MARTRILSIAALAIAAAALTEACKLIVGAHFDEPNPTDVLDGGVSTSETGPISDSTSAAKGGVWCNGHAANATACWDFDVDGQSVDAGWEEVFMEKGGAATLDTNNVSPPSAFLAQLTQPGVTQARATLRSSPYATMRLTEVEFDVKVSSCSQADVNGVALAAVTIGNIEGNDFWQGQLVYTPQNAKLHVVAVATNQTPPPQLTKEPNPCTTPEVPAAQGFCLARKQLSLNSWQRVRFVVQRAPSFKAQLTLLLDGVAVIDPWVVNLQPPAGVDSTFLAVGLDAVVSTTGCTAFFDNVVLSVKP